MQSSSRGSYYKDNHTNVSNSHSAKTNYANVDRHAIADHIRRKSNDDSASRNDYLLSLMSLSDSKSDGTDSGRVSIKTSQSPMQSRSNSMSSVRSLIRDRSLERSERNQIHGSLHREQVYSKNKTDNEILSQRLVRGTSLDMVDKEPLYSKVQSLGRERGRHGVKTSLLRSRSIDQEYFLNQSFGSSSDIKHGNDSLILDLQVSIIEMNKECAKLQQELNSSREKLESSMNSIRTFWSPELKKERVLRKEECSKVISLNGQMKLLQCEKENLIHAARTSEEKLAETKSNISATDFCSDTLQRDKDRQNREIKVLRKTIEEMEMRIDTQKTTLQTRDESIKKLLEMIKSKGLVSAPFIDEDILTELERQRIKLAEAENTIFSMKRSVEQKDREINTYKEMTEAFKITTYTYSQEEMDSLSSLKIKLETKDLRTLSLETELKVVEDELFRLREESSSLSQDTMNSHSELESYKNKEKQMKMKMDNSKAEAQRYEAEVNSLKTQLDSLERQNADHLRHVEVLKEQINAKEQQISFMQTEGEELRNRLSEREQLIDKKCKQVMCSTAEKKRIEAQLADLQDQGNIKDRKSSVQQRKIEKYEDMIKENEEQISSLREKLQSIATHHSSSETAVTNLEHKIMEKDKQIERLKEKCDALEVEQIDEMSHFEKSINDLKSRSEQLQSQLHDKEQETLKLRDEVSELLSVKIQKSKDLKDAETLTSKHKDFIDNLKKKLTSVEEDKKKLILFADSAEKNNKDNLEEVSKSAEDRINKAQCEVDRLLEILKQSEDEKHAKDKELKDLQEIIKEYKQKVGTLKRSSQSQKKQSAHMLEEARKRDVDSNEDVTHMKEAIQNKQGRIQELEEALRESVSIAAQREMVLASFQSKSEDADYRVKDTSSENEKLRKENAHIKEQIKQLNHRCEEQNSKLYHLHHERTKNLEDAYEMKQEAILAAISEKDAHIAILESGGGYKQHKPEIDRLNKEKDHLQRQLKEIHHSFRVRIFL